MRARRAPDEPQITIRLPVDVERALRRRAAEDRTSMASVIIAALDCAGVTGRKIDVPKDIPSRARRSARKGGE